MINSFLQKLSTRVTAKSKNSKRIAFLFLTSVTLFRAITMCSAFTPDCGYDNSTIILIGDVYSPNTNCSGELCLHKKTFQSLGRSDYQCPQCASVCHVRKILFKDQNKSFFLSFWSGGLHFWRESKVNSRWYWRGVLSCQVLFQQREMRNCWRLCLFVHKVLFTLQEHVNTTKTDKKRFFFATKRWIWYPTKLLVIVAFPSSKYRKKELCGDNKIQETIGNLYCPTCRNEKCVYNWTNKPTSYCDCKKCKSCFLVLNIPFKHQKPTIMLFGGDGTHCFARKTSGDYKKEKLSPFLKNFLRQSQSAAPKKAKMNPNME